MHDIVMALLEHRARCVDAEAQIVRRRIVRMDQKLQSLLLGDRRELGRDHRGIGDPRRQRAEAVGVAAHHCEFHVAVGEIVLFEHHARKQIR